MQIVAMCMVRYNIHTAKQSRRVDVVNFTVTIDVSLDHLNPMKHDCIGCRWPVAGGKNHLTC